MGKTNTRNSMKNRKSLINAILSGKIEEIKRIKKEANEANVIILSCQLQSGKYVSAMRNEAGERQEYTPEEVEKLEKECDVIFLTRAPGEITGRITTSEDEVDL